MSKRVRPLALVAVAAAVVAIGLDVSAGSGSTRAPRLVYVTGTATSTPQVWATGLRHGARHLVGPGDAPMLAPDGAIIAASSPAQQGPALILYSAGGAVIRRYFDAAQATAVAQAWSPDSRYLAVVLSSRNPASATASGLAVIDTGTLTWSLLARDAIYGASFASDGSDRIAYAVASSPALTAPVNIYTVGADGSAPAQITHDARSLYPVWGAKQIAYDRERLRPRAAPAYEVWLMNADGTHPVQLTRMRVPPLLYGLVPLAFSATDGGWLLAQYEGLNTSEAWTIAVATRRARELEVGGRDVTAAALSRSGAAALIDGGGFLRPPSQGTVEELPLQGGPAIKLVAHGSEPSWNL
jgi:hypothetical protein